MVKGRKRRFITQHRHVEEGSRALGFIFSLLRVQTLKAALFPALPPLLE
jgi:hypothetical protein